VVLLEVFGEDLVHVLAGDGSLYVMILPRLSLVLITPEITKNGGGHCDEDEQRHLALCSACEWP
jgi:hypothetical protein